MTVVDQSALHCEGKCLGTSLVLSFDRSARCKVVVLSKDDLTNHRMAYIILWVHIVHCRDSCVVMHFLEIATWKSKRELIVSRLQKHGFVPRDAWKEVNAVAKAALFCVLRPLPTGKSYKITKSI